MLISEETKFKVLDRADIAEIVGDFVKLKRSGNQLRGISPFTNEKTPSFYVLPDKGIFKDFSSGKGGDVITFLMDHEKLSYPEAIRYLAKRYHVDIMEAEPEDPGVEKERELIFNMNNFAARFFSSQLYAKENDRALEYIQSRWSQDDIIAWQIGFAPDGWNHLGNHATSAGYDQEHLKTANLLREKNGKVFDYFRNRIIFPILDASGNIAGFGGRAIPGTDEQVKYINSPESPVYDKSRILYGLYQGRKAIVNSKICHLVEGYADVIRMHSVGLVNTVAPCGTGFTEYQARAILKLTTKINIFFDGDPAGFEATKRAGEIALKAGLHVVVTRPPDGEDPDSFINEDTASWIKNNSSTYLSWRAQDLMREIGEDPLARYHALKEIARILLHIEDKTMRDVLAQELMSTNKIPKKQLQDLLTEGGLESSINNDPLPEEVDARQFERWGFYEHKNEYYFKTKDGITKQSNFILKPLFHVKSTTDKRRIFELLNCHGYKEVIDFDMQEMTSLQAFRKNVEGLGNFLFWGTDIQFGKIKLKLYEETKTCLEIKNLGWQKEGFWAWSNGIIDAEGTFLNVDEYGLVEYVGNNYYIPAFSKIFLNDRSVFIDERRFIYKKREVSLRNWSDQFVEVFGSNAKIGICFWIASLFRDFILHIFKNFPMLNLFGPKGTGKSQMAMSLSCLFGKGQTPFNIHNGTKPGLAEHIQQFVNAIAWVDEYKNSLEYDKIETLKSIYDSIGRSRLNMDKGKKKETTLVNSAVIISGQEMPTADVALFSRMIFLRFHKTNFSEEEKNRYDTLKSMESDGLSHLTSEVISHRAYFEKNFWTNYEMTLRDLSNVLSEDQIEDRIIRNISTVLAAFKTLEHKLDFSFTSDQLMHIAADTVKIQNSQVSTSNEVSVFWNILEALFDENTIIDEWHFRIKYTSQILTTTKSEIKLAKAMDVLKFKFNAVAKLYSEHSRKMGIKPLPHDTLRYYLENHEAFIGVEKSCQFISKNFDNLLGKTVEQKQITSAYCFDYSKLNINLNREAIEVKDAGENSSNLYTPGESRDSVDQDMPF